MTVHFQSIGKYGLTEIDRAQVLNVEGPVVGDVEPFVLAALALVGILLTFYEAIKLHRWFARRKCRDGGSVEDGGSG